jgi:hypothetical protein
MSKSKSSGAMLAPQVTIREFLELMPHVVRIRKPVLLRGMHGIGKSEIVKLFCNNAETPDGKPYKMLMRRPSQMSEGDLCGIPRPEVRKCGMKVTDYYPPAWYADACTEPVVLFLDELDRASTDVRQGFFELADSRSIFGNELHPHTLVFAAINGGDGGHHYQVYNMDPAELDRWVVFDLCPSQDEWLEWGEQTDENGRDNILPIIREFMSHYKGDENYLEFAGEDFEPNRVYPSRRSWKRFSDCLAGKRELLDMWGSLTLLGSAFIGVDAAIAFQKFAQTYSRMVTPKDIIYGGRYKRTSDYEIIEHIELIKKIKNWEPFKEELKDEHLQNLWNYVKLLPGEAFMVFQKMFRKHSPENREKLTKLTNNEYSKLTQTYLGAEIISEKVEGLRNSAALERIMAKKKERENQGKKDER